MGALVEEKVASPLLLALRPWQPAWLAAMPSVHKCLQVEAQKAA
eukprot:CAMPEP_0115108050 /NCGR_PEP_ID=MMETSP0227-20121206/37723_1 /TAXON_ID=89957 /ORGANISM="Polarella glacialis, Strain CCMP 1383" /LENGTH=43 /DNA_ID= /DNA_START= /DNA_END= /DNA_ORIENTATION=